MDGMGWAEMGGRSLGRARNKPAADDRRQATDRHRPQAQTTDQARERADMIGRQAGQAKRREQRPSRCGAG
ncbi:hypothetical protein B0I35DRAFT_442001 [Stachybotrys elegans]|uniref:Uncharacterized protein n=1 Tax=Stachybotrys elegans TaxID=80388 RepID=A0A8K0WM98_9HYPO|nr:hypothetical protein B0I35DRAFT_442001 [Stachybotrys elegans]